MQDQRNVTRDAHERIADFKHKQHWNYDISKEKGTMMRKTANLGVECENKGGRNNDKEKGPLPRQASPTHPSTAWRYPCTQGLDTWTASEKKGGEARDKRETAKDKENEKGNGKKREGYMT